jgi:DNA-binding NarL/FixJ family response regulator
MAGDRNIHAFIIEDDPVYREMLADLLRDNYPRVVSHAFETAEEALNEPRNPDIIILDYFLNRNHTKAMNGMDALRAFSEHMPGARTVILSAQEDINISVSMMKYGAYDYIVKNETDKYRLQNSLNHIITMMDYDRRIRLTRMALGFIAGALLVVLLFILLGGT